MSSRWSDDPGVARGEQYDRRWAEMAAAGQSIHGEADLVCGLLADGWWADGSEVDRSPAVLDAGCGTGRVAIELADRGLDVHGVDLDPAMLDAARDKAPHLAWTEADLVAVALGARFDLVVMAGNVMVFVAPGTEGAVVANLAAHLRPGGLLVAGFQLVAGGLDAVGYDAHAERAGLVPLHRWSTWERDPFTGGDYLVAVHRRI